MEYLSRFLRQVSRETLSSLHVRNYRLYYIGQIISTSGTFMQNIAQAWLVLKLTNSGTALGLTTALQYLPILILGPYAVSSLTAFPNERSFTSPSPFPACLL